MKLQLTSSTTNRGGESYWFAIPNVGHVAKFLVRSRVGSPVPPEYVALRRS